MTTTIDRSITMTTFDRPDRRHLVDLPAVAEFLGVTERHVRRLVAERRIPFYKWGHLLRFDLVEIEAWVASHRVAPLRRPDFVA